MKRISLLLVSALSASCLLPAYALGETEFKSGVTYYKAKNYLMAAKEFESAIAHGNTSQQAYLYAAHSYMAYGDRIRAAKKYHQITSLFKDTPSAQMAAQALTRLDPQGLYKDKSAGAGTLPTAAESSTSTASKKVKKDKSNEEEEDEDEEFAKTGLPPKVRAPNYARVFYKSQDQEILVEVRINGRPIMMEFDTGAPGICIDKNMLKELGIAQPSGKESGKTGGASNNTKISYWNIKANVQVGPITIENARLEVFEKIQTKPLLGQGFFKDFDYTIDHSAKCIEFRRKGTSKLAGGYTIPFTYKKRGNRIIVELEINGKKGPVMLDTGNTGSGIKFFSKEQMKKFGVSELPADAQLSSSVGISGTGSCYRFSVKRAKLGPIEKSDLSASLGTEVDDDEDLPLLGQEFVSGWQVSVDMEKKVLHLLRR